MVLHYCFIIINYTKLTYQDHQKMGVIFPMLTELCSSESATTKAKH